eukprot:TRINITY_DN114597_c0_g1_i1.p1 TRINITY_DN114597_c0_g1~~TRINITY_DN114597_c0_g1_i1.p1  ORF type:complete len:305 (+),score=91.66 TRINITY_DN114597_c0_g1_i1:80-916(+)
MAFRDAGRIPPLTLAAGLAAAAGLGVLVLTNCMRSHSAQSSEEREQLLSMLKVMTRRFLFPLCRDVAAVARTVRAKMEVQKVNVTDENFIKEELMSQCKVLQMLQDIQTKVARQFGVSPARFEQMQLEAAEDEEVQAYTTGFQAMLDDALEGRDPILWNVDIPKGLSEEKAMEVLREVQEREVKEVETRVGNRQLSHQELGEALTAAHHSAWNEGLKARSDLLDQGGPEVYHSAVASFSRNTDFAKDYKKMEEAHQQRMIRLFKKDASGLMSLQAQRR